MTTPKDSEWPELPPELIDLTTIIDTRPESLATGDVELQSAALTATKFAFDLGLTSEGRSWPLVSTLLNSLTNESAPVTRSAAKRKRDGTVISTPKLNLEQTPLSSLYIEGMDEDQIWKQLDMRAQTLCEALNRVLEPPRTFDDEDEEDTKVSSDIQADDVVGSEGEDFEIDSDSDDSLEELSSEGQESDDFEDDESESMSHLGDSTMELKDPDDEDDDEDDASETEQFNDLDRRRSEAEAQHPHRRNAHGLDDGFFDLAAFNAETEQAEARTVSKGALAESDEEDDDEEDLDLFARVDDPVEEDDLYDDNGGELFYTDFFKPPRNTSIKAKKIVVRIPPKTSPSKRAVRFHDEVKVRSIKPKGRGMSVRAMHGLSLGDDDDEDEDEDDEDEEEEVAENGALSSFSSWKDSDDESEDDEEADDDEEDESDDGSAIEELQGARMRVQDDLFADEDGSNEEDDSGLTEHDKRMQQLQAQIAELEQQNIAKKGWQLMGEASARDRPQNSALEENLEFERLKKAAPVITEEVILGLEDKIKARIKENRFDDVVRRRETDNKPFLPSRLFELQDTKSAQSLSQIYEDEYTKAQSNGKAVDVRDEKLQKEHSVIDSMWIDICAKLDALSNAHFVPKQPKSTISTLSNVAATSLESALPTSQTISTLLAPEEVFAPKASDARARTEMTPTEKRALRNKSRKIRKKSRDMLNASVAKFGGEKKVRSLGAAKRQKEDALKSLIKTGKGVTVVGKKSKDLLNTFKSSKNSKQKEER